MSDLSILHVHPTVGIGGVETYLLRLAGEQIRRGHRVGLLTAGGAFEESFTREGVQLVKLRPHPENLQAAVAQVRLLGLDLVHAHNCKAARFGRRLADALGAAYLMSVHGPRPAWKRLIFRDWSRFVVAMSEGDRDNITAFGGVAPARVLLSFYGIDTGRFHPGLDAGPLCQELGLPEGALPILAMSRFANQKGGIAMALLDALAAISAQAPGVVALLVGEGPDEERLRARVGEVNHQLGRRAALWVGPRQDVERFFCLAAVVVATANTALESLACATPTLAAGRRGYFGRVTPDNLEPARATCFADHGSMLPRPTADLLAREIGAVLARLPEARAEALTLCRIVADRFTVPRMAEDMDRIYDRLLPGGSSAHREEAPKCG